MTWFISDFIQDKLEDTESPGTAADNIQGNKELGERKCQLVGGEGAAHQN